MREAITPQLCQSLMSYDPETGLLHWRARPASMFKPGVHTAEHSSAAWNAKWAGREALSNINPDGYKSGRILRVSVPAHRAAWAIVHGAWPERFIDHINGNRADNRIANLRDVTSSENQQNQKMHAQNKSGVCGVWFDKRRSRWVAEIVVDYKKIHLGQFRDLADAARARSTAEQSYGFHENHGRPDLHTTLARNAMSDAGLKTSTTNTTGD